RADDHDEVLDPYPGREREQLLHRRVPDGQASIRHLVAVNHDVAAEPHATVAHGPGHVEGVRIVEAHREMVPAVRVERGDAIQPFGDLMIALPELRAEPSAAG